MLHNKSKAEMMRRLIQPPDEDRDGDVREKEVDDYIYYDDLVGGSNNGQDLFEMEDKKTRAFSCEVCKYRTTTASQLRKHMAFFHKDAEIKHQVRVISNTFCHT